jgi:hypothetical protein
MKTLDRDATFTTKLRSIVQTGPTGQQALAGHVEVSQQRRIAWQRVIDYQLVEWGRNPDALADEGVEPPTLEAISAACEVAKALRDACSECPSRVVPNGNGGVVFELSRPDYFQTMEAKADGSVEFAVFNDCRLVSREKLQ